jgi:signal transduction histidine kinase
MHRILVVEDEPQIRENLVWLLEASGYDVIAAADGAEGIRAARDEQPALIVCDVMMPGTDGLGVLRALRETPETAAIPFIFLTARTEHDDVRAGMMAGADDYITKPFAADDVLGAIEVRLAKKASIEALYAGDMEALRSNISRALPHELRTPLASILGFTQVLLVESRSMAPDVAHKMLRDVYQSARRLERTVENFSFFTQLMVLRSDPEQAGQWRKRCTPGAGRLAGEVAQWVAYEHRRPGDLALDGAGGDAAIADEHLKNAVAELVDNAFKFSEAGTPVTVRVSQEAEAFVLEVRDEGRGLHPGDVRRAGAFLQFSREHYEHQGSGLGLAIVYGIADLYRGSVRVESALGEGTSVRIELPAARLERVQSRTAQPASAA